MTKTIRVGNIDLGGDSPVRIQSMTKTRTEDTKATLSQIKELSEAGCEMIRIAVPDGEAASGLKEIVRESPIPVLADIHFSPRLALASLEAGVAQIRWNPGNIERGKAYDVIRLAAGWKVAVRVGVNVGSLPSNIPHTTDGIVDFTMDSVKFVEDIWGSNPLIEISAKTSSAIDTIAIYWTLSTKTEWPLHIGVTEAGLPLVGAIRSACGLGPLLIMRIGSSIRVSLTGNPTLEIVAAKEMLRCLNIREFNEPILISCPTCGRTEIDLVPIAKEVKTRLTEIKKPIKVSVMGCRVNGIGEAQDADYAICGGKGRGAILKKGKIVRSVPESDLVDALMDEIKKEVMSKSA